MFVCICMSVSEVSVFEKLLQSLCNKSLPMNKISLKVKWTNKWMKKGIKINENI